MDRTINLLLIEDDEEHYEIINRSIKNKSSNINVIRTDSVCKAVEEYNLSKPDIILCDMRLPDGSGMDIVNQFSEIPVIIMTSFGSEEIAVQSMKAGAFNYMVKSPENFNEISYFILRSMREWENIALSKNLEKQLIQSEKLSAVGQLTAGIAHEFNNILSIIKTSVHVINETEKFENYETRENFEIIENQVDRAKNIVLQLLTFSRPQPAKTENIQINDVIDDIIEIQKKQFEIENIKIIKKFRSKFKVEVDPGQMQQVFLNLIINARHAIKPKGEGSIKICTADESNNVKIYITDDGIGISKENLKKIFTPFFTTKGAFATDDFGIKGTGLGLSVSQKIIEQYSGKIVLTSECGVGTKVCVTLPSAEIENNCYQESLKNNRKNHIPPVKNTNLKILIIDDELQLLKIFKRLLNKIGYQNVTTADTVEKALSVTSDCRFDVIFLDINMPGIKGFELCKKIVRNNENVKIIVMSGDLNLSEKNLQQPEICSFLKKPFDLLEIKNIISKI
ncbi:response regulator [Candidatus Dependentiae bacterium]|nr:response regulator [Candidatus Dependentiae bacterium]